jgi:hypothetical protein
LLYLLSLPKRHVEYTKIESIRTILPRLITLTTLVIATLGNGHSAFGHMLNMTNIDIQVDAPNEALVTVQIETASTAKVDLFTRAVS